MVDIIKGSTTKHVSSQKLIDFFNNNITFEGHLYIGYPILFTAGESITIDALWISRNYGIVIFDLVEGTELESQDQIQDDMYSKMHSFLMQHTSLVKKRNLLVNIDVITFAPACTILTEINFKCATSDEDLYNKLIEIDKWEFPDLYDVSLSVIQSVTRLKVSNKRSNVTKEDSRGAILKKHEKTIASLDNEQEKAVIESFEGIHRVRGLAGSGKTIVLALKVAYLHTQNPEWDIAVTFNTRSLKFQFIEFIERFCIEKKGEKPDFSKIRILQAWGSSNTDGIYYQTCIDHNIEYYDFRTAKGHKRLFDKDDKTIFDYVCSKAFNEIKEFKESYDCILVDEAQDLPESFLKICYNLLRNPKRLVYAYDELQKLNEGSSLRNPIRIFGSEIQFKDTILDVCYRNSRPILVTAHALGFGIYREKGLVQFFDQPQLWKEVGYEVKDGSLEANQNVTLQRTSYSSPPYLEHSPIDDTLIFKIFENTQQQAEWLANEIQKNLSDDELLYKDIIVINPNPLTTKNEISPIRLKLYEKNINAHIAGDFNADVFFEEESITFTGINRAKGNEVPMVYIVNADECVPDTLFATRDLITKRNVLFTAITRSKAWVRVLGIGSRMDDLIAEFNKVKENNFELKFRYPTDEQIKQMNLIHRDITESEKQVLKKDISTFKELNKIINRIKKGQNYIEDYPENVRDFLNKLINDVNEE